MADNNDDDKPRIDEEAFRYNPELTNTGNYYENERKARALDTQELGDYMLARHERWPMWLAARKDGKPVPKSLTGHWPTVASFRDQVKKIHG